MQIKTKESLGRLTVDVTQHKAIDAANAASSMQQMHGHTEPRPCYLALG